jgi:hypothetical protein
MSGPGEYALTGGGDPDLHAKKDTNPKDALGVKKPPLHCLPGRVIFELGLAMLEGARKYGSHNYRESGIRYSVYFDAAMRHLWLAWEGEDIDPDSGQHHIIKAMACLTVLRDGQLAGNYMDDRPIRQPGGLGLKELTQGVLTLMEKYPNVVAPYTEITRQSKLVQSPTDKIRAGMQPFIDQPPIQVITPPSAEGLVAPDAILRAEGEPNRTLQDVTERATLDEKRSICAGCGHVTVCSIDLRFTALQDGVCKSKVTY